MELHISSDDANFITNIYEYADNEIESLDGYASIYGYNMNMELQHKVIVNRTEVGKKFPKRVTFGQMLDMMKQAGTSKLYFQREDWRDTHHCIALNNFDIKALYIDEYYENTNLTKDSKPLGVKQNGVPFNKRPYIPSYMDMFAYSWIVYYSEDAKTYIKGNEDEEESFDNCTV